MEAANPEGAFGRKPPILRERADRKVPPAGKHDAPAPEVRERRGETFRI